MKVLDPLIYPVNFDEKLSQDPVQTFKSLLNSSNSSLNISPVGEIIDYLSYKTLLHFLAYIANNSQLITTSD